MTPEQKHKQKLKMLETIIRAYGDIPTIAVGYPASIGGESGIRYPGNRRSPKEKVRTPPTVVQVAIWNNFGTRYIPSRPFFNSATKKIPAQTEQLRKDMLNQVFNGVFYGAQYGRDLTEALNMIGAKAVDVIRREITMWSDPPNSLKTINGGWMTRDGKSFYIHPKKANNPLVDTGLLRKSATWELREKK